MSFIPENIKKYTPEELKAFAELMENNDNEPKVKYIKHVLPLDLYHLEQPESLSSCRYFTKPQIDELLAHYGSRENRWVKYNAGAIFYAKIDDNGNFVSWRYGWLHHGSSKEEWDGEYFGPLNEMTYVEVRPDEVPETVKKLLDEKPEDAGYHTVYPGYYGADIENMRENLDDVQVGGTMIDNNGEIGPGYNLDEGQRIETTFPGTYDISG